MKHVVFNYLIVKNVNNTVAVIVSSENMTQKSLCYMLLEMNSCKAMIILVHGEKV